MMAKKTLADYVNEDIMLSDCTDMSHSLGIQSMPDGYALMLNADATHFYGLRHDGLESAIHWNKWAIYAWAKRDSMGIYTACN